MRALRIIPCPSPNFGPRRQLAKPDLVVLHYTAMADTRDALERLRAPEHEVSAHYLIAPEGELYQLVDEEMRAWHAGAGGWGDCVDVNSHSIGIELANDGLSPFPDPQMKALSALLEQIMARWGIPPERVIGHSDLAPSRKGDPGARFDWRRLAKEGLAVWPDVRREAGSGDATGRETLPLCQGFLAHARRFGYSDIASFDDILNAFRSRFRPWARGELDLADLASISELAARYPVDRGMMSA